jgi:DNA polymerase III alpha subunit
VPGGRPGRDGRFIKTAGLVLVRQMPGTAKGVMFMTIEDETGASNLVIWKTLYEKQRRIALGAHLIGVDGRIQREGDVVHLVAYQLHDLSGVMATAAGSRGRRWRPVLGQAQPQLLLRSTMSDQPSLFDLPGAAAPPFALGATCPRA